MTGAAPTGLEEPEALPPAMLVYDGAWQVRFASPEINLLFGQPAGASLVGRSLEEMTRWAAYAGICGPGDPEAQHQALMALDRSRPGRRTFRATDGRWIEINYAPLPEGGCVTMFVDATPHRLGEARALGRLRLAETALLGCPFGIGLFDQDGRLRLASPSCEPLLGLPPGSLRPGLGQDAIAGLIARHRVLPADEAARLERSLRLDGGRRQDSIFRWQDGQAVRLISQPLPDGGTMSVIDDITPMQQVEDEARRRAALLNGVLAALPHGVCVYGPDQRLRHVNAAYQAIMRGAEVTVGEHLSEIIARRAALGTFLDDATPEEVFRRQMHFGPPRTRPRRDGTVISAISAPLPDGGHISVISDVTALHRAQTDARHRADLLQVMLDSMPHGVCLFDKDARLTAANRLAAPMIGLPPEALQPGTPLQELKRRQLDSGEFTADAQFHHRASQAPDEMQIRLGRYQRTRPDGRVIEVSSDPTAEGGFIRTYRDVTEEHRARAEIERARIAAEEADAAKSRFLATMSHELRTPLHAVIGFSEALQADPNGANVEEFAGTILEAGRHLLSLIDEILEVAQVGTGPLPAQIRPLHLPTVLGNMVRLMGTAAEEARVALILDPLPELPRALAEERRLRQVLLNLISNALKFTPQGGEVHVSAEALEEGVVELRVSDSGIGIDPEQVERAFEPFVQLEPTHSRRYAGSGLGLYLARALSRAMGAELRLDSAPGRGTVARLRLPAHQHQEQTA